MSEFVQIIRVKSPKLAELKQMSREYQERHDAAGHGLLSSEVLRDLNHPDSYLALVRFTSPEAARENSARPETQAWFEKFKTLIEGEPEYIDTEQVFVL